MPPLLERLNTRAFQKLPDSRASAFAELDSPALQPLPLQPCVRQLPICDLSRMWKMWCSLAGLEGSFASHTPRKTFGYLNRVEGRASVEVLMKAYGHATAATTLTYMCIQDDELKALYKGEF